MLFQFGRRTSQGTILRRMFKLFFTKKDLKNQCCGYGMFIPDLVTEFFPSRIRIFSILDPGSVWNNLNIFNPKKWFWSSRKYDPGGSSRILTFYPSQIPDPEVKTALDPGSGSATLKKIEVFTFSWRYNSHVHFRCQPRTCCRQLPRTLSKPPTIRSSSALRITAILSNRLVFSRIEVRLSKRIKEGTWKAVTKCPGFGSSDPNFWLTYQSCSFRQWTSGWKKINLYVFFLLPTFWRCPVHWHLSS